MIQYKEFYSKLKRIGEVGLLITVVLTIIILGTQYASQFLIGLFLGVVLSWVVIPVYLLFTLGRGIDPEFYSLDEVEVIDERFARRD